jgi:hypothetical protein
VFLSITTSATESLVVKHVTVKWSVGWLLRFEVTGVLLVSSMIVITPEARAQLPTIIDLQEEAADVTVFGARRADKAAWEMATGDFNGDHATDWAIFSAGASPLGRQGVGILDIVWGGEPLSSTIDLLIEPSEVSTVIPAAGNTAFYTSLSAADFNRDGCDDIALGFQCNSAFTDCRGKVYVVFGARSFPDTVDISNTSHPVTIITGALVGEHLGLASTAGDVNGDGYPDIIVAAPASILGGGGRVYVIYGRGDFPPSIALSQTQTHLTRIIDPEYGWGNGLGGLACGDLDKDGFSDVLIGASGDITARSHGKATIVYGSPALPDTIFLVRDSPVAMTRIYSDPNNPGKLGSSVAFGDVTGDGYLDVALAAATMDLPPSCNECGEIFVIHGSDALPDSIHINAQDVPMTRILGSGSFQYSGGRMISRDITGDHFDDLVITSGTDIIPGEVFTVIVVYGSVDLPDSIYLATDSSVTRIYGETPGDYFGVSMRADDLNGDGVLDLAVGAHLADPLGRDRAGKAFLFYGVRGSPIGVEIDIKPGSCPNLLDMSSEPRDAISKKDGVLPVAVLGSETLDVTEIDLVSLHLEDVAPLSCDVRDVATPAGDGEDCVWPTPRRDGWDDLLLYFRRTEVADSLGPAHDGDILELTLTGLLNDGTPVRGTDCVTIVGLPSEPRSGGSHGSVALRKPAPNPFNPTTRIRYTLPMTASVVVSIYDVAGRFVENLVDQVQPAGDHVVEWDASAMSSGVYFCRMQVGEITETHRLVLIK